MNNIFMMKYFRGSFQWLEERLVDSECGGSETSQAGSFTLENYFPREPG